jgi:hypothetical protein
MWAKINGEERMATSKQELKAKLMQEAEAVIDELLDWHLSTAEPNLGQVEEKVLGLRQRLSEQMSQAVIANQEAVRPVPGPACGRCGKEMRYKGLKRLQVTSWVGELELDRGYYYCEDCRTGLFPPGSATSIMG